MLTEQILDFLEQIPSVVSQRVAVWVSDHHSCDGTGWKPLLRRGGLVAKALSPHRIIQVQIQPPSRRPTAATALPSRGADKASATRAPP